MVEKKCSFCRSGAASVFFQWCDLARSRTAAMCPGCAGKAGLGQKDFHKPVAEVFSALCRREAAADAAPGTTPDKCPNCGTAVQTILEKRLIGCEKCYVVFRGLIKSCLAGTRGDHEESLVDRLMREQAEAIEHEDYERAARLRDQISTEAANAKG